MNRAARIEDGVVVWMRAGLLPVERCDAPVLLVDRMGADLIEIGCTE
jgi:hypothetical protein